MSEDRRWETIALWAAGLFGLSLIILAVALQIAFATTRFAGEYDNVPDNIRSWFKSVRSPNGIPCCDIADGHRTTWRAVPETEDDSGYEVPIGDEAGNPVGEAIVWYTQQGPAVWYIRCFVPDGGV
jgi:hypothetical protein